MTETKTGFPIPDDVEFVEYMGKQIKKAGGGKKGKVSSLKGESQDDLIVRNSEEKPSKVVSFSNKRLTLK